MTISEYEFFGVNPGAKPMVVFPGSDGDIDLDDMKKAIALLTVRVKAVEEVLDNVRHELSEESMRAAVRAVAINYGLESEF